MHNGDEYIHDLSPLSSFFKQFHIARLFLNAEYDFRELNLDIALGSLGDQLLSLEELALDGELLENSWLEGCLLTERFPQLHTLHILGRTVLVDRLKAMLASSPVQTVQFRWHERHSSEVLQAVSEVVPSVVYSLHNTLMDDQPFPWDLPSISYSKNGVLSVGFEKRRSSCQGNMMTSLRQTRSMLDTPTIGYSPSVTINDLPTEILCHIFMLAKVHCTLDALSDRSVAKYRSGGKPLPVFSPDNISPVCVYWRKLFNNTPALWTHIDLGIGQLQDANFAFHAQRSLERANQLPLYIHVEGRRTHIDPVTVVALLVPYANRIVSLDLCINSLASQTILVGLFNTPYRGSVRHLCLYDEDYVVGPLEPSGSLFPLGLLDELLLSIPSLTIHGPSLNYNSPAFRGLTDLAIVFSDMCPTPYQLTQILVACPELRSLTLLEVSLEPGNLPIKPANLPSLQALDLRYMRFDDVVTITSCIVPRRGLSVSLTLNMQPDYDSDVDEDDDGQMHDLSPLSSFFKQFHVARLFLNADQITGGLDLYSALYPLAKPLPSLEELALDGALLDDDLVKGSLLAERFPRLHTLHIIGATVPVDRLKAMLASLPTQVVCFRWRERHSSEVLKAISEVVPSVLYSLYNTLRDTEPFPWDLPSISYYDNGLI
ncbi:hypothetical protein BDV93DRAFT_544782 [Ceratobasidium sp. AG-I]|nr:hypothetical protein BDV93DRAFT_544782 [Ceratobasidium sp. AG-I]